MSELLRDDFAGFNPIAEARGFIEVDLTRDYHPESEKEDETGFRLVATSVADTTPPPKCWAWYGPSCIAVLSAMNTIDRAEIDRCRLEMLRTWRSASETPLHLLMPGIDKKGEVVLRYSVYHRENVRFDEVGMHLADSAVAIPTVDVTFHSGSKPLLSKILSTVIKKPSESKQVYLDLSSHAARNDGYIVGLVNTIVDSLITGQTIPSKKIITKTLEDTLGAHEPRPPTTHLRSHR